MDHTRHSGIFSCNETAITLIGAGGIGAISAVALAKMGVPFLCVIDDDTVDGVNLPTQFHPMGQLGSLKINSVVDLVGQFSDETAVEAFNCRVNGETDPGTIMNPIIISAVDSIKARKEIWTAVRRTNWSWYLDARMGSEIFSLYSVSANDCLWYNDAISIADDSLIADEPCTQKATIYTACMAAGHIGNAVRKIVTGEKLPRLLQHNIKDMVMLTI